jgi:hypothetical protein
MTEHCAISLYLFVYEHLRTFGLCIGPFWCSAVYLEDNVQ